MPMSESDRKHFEEVKDIFLAMQWVAALGLAVFGIYLLRDAVRTGKMREAAAFHAARMLRLRYRWMLWQYGLRQASAVSCCWQSSSTGRMPLL